MSPRRPTLAEPPAESDGEGDLAVDSTRRRPPPKQSGQFLAEALAPRLRGPRNLDDFQRMFPDEASCLLYAAAVRWSDGFACPHCQAATQAETSGGGLVRCALCGEVSTPTTGTMLERSPLPLRTWLRALFELVSTESGADMRRLRGVLGTTRPELVVSWLQALRDVFDKVWREPLRGLVEVAKVPIEVMARSERGRPHMRHAMVAVAVEVRGGDELGGVRVRSLPRVEPSAMQSFVRASVADGSAVRTSHWHGYQRLSKLGYEHVVAPNPPGDERAMRVVGQVASILRLWLFGTPAVELDRLDYYLAEFTFRYDARLQLSPSDRSAMFDKVLRLVLETDGRAARARPMPGVGGKLGRAG